MSSDDLDCRDLVEVRRRAVEPVVTSLIQPEELEELVVRFGPPGGFHAASPDDLPGVWVALTARGEPFAYAICKATEERWNAEAVAGTLAGALEDWVCETSFAWGQRRLARYHVPT